MPSQPGRLRRPDLDRAGNVVRRHSRLLLQQFRDSIQLMDGFSAVKLHELMPIA